MTDPLADDDVAIAVEGAQGLAVIGRVVEAGARAGGLLDRRVLAGAIDPCGECDVCRCGGAAVCPRARHRSDVGERVVAAARWVVPLGEGAGELALPSPAGAAVAGEIALAYTLYARTGLGPHEPAVIVGEAPLARYLVQILRAKGLTPVVAVDPARAAWADWLVARGASIAAVRTSDSDDQARAAVAAAIAALGGGARPWRVLAVAADAALRAAALAGPRATLTLLASPALPALPADLAAREVTIITVAGAHPDLIVEAAAMCVRGEIELG